jgi:hypothetical protein
MEHNTKIKIFLFPCSFFGLMKRKNNHAQIFRKKPKNQIQLEAILEPDVGTLQWPVEPKVLTTSWNLKQYLVLLSGINAADSFHPYLTIWSDKLELVWSAELGFPSIKTFAYDMAISEGFVYLLVGNIQTDELGLSEYTSNQIWGYHLDYYRNHRRKTQETETTKKGLSGKGILQPLLIVDPPVDRDNWCNIAVKNDVLALVSDAGEILMLSIAGNVMANGKLFLETTIEFELELDNEEKDMQVQKIEFHEIQEMGLLCYVADMKSGNTLRPNNVIPFIIRVSLDGVIIDKQTIIPFLIRVSLERFLINSELGFTEDGHWERSGHWDIKNKTYDLSCDCPDCAGCTGGTKYLTEQGNCFLDKRTFVLVLKVDRKRKICVFRGEDFSLNSLVNSIFHFFLQPCNLNEALHQIRHKIQFKIPTNQILSQVLLHLEKSCLV